MEYSELGGDSDYLADLSGKLIVDICVAQLVDARDGGTQFVAE